MGVVHAIIAMAQVHARRCLTAQLTAMENIPRVQTVPVGMHIPALPMGAVTAQVRVEHTLRWARSVVVKPAKVGPVHH